MSDSGTNSMKGAGKIVLEGEIEWILSFKKSRLSDRQGWERNYHDGGWAGQMWPNVWTPGWSLFPHWQPCVTRRRKTSLLSGMQGGLQIWSSLTWGQHFFVSFHSSSVQEWIDFQINTILRCFPLIHENGLHLLVHTNFLDSRPAHHIEVEECL